MQFAPAKTRQADPGIPIRVPEPVKEGDREPVPKDAIKAGSRISPLFSRGGLLVLLLLALGILLHPHHLKWFLGAGAALCFIGTGLALVRWVVRTADRDEQEEEAREHQAASEQAIPPANAIQERTELDHLNRPVSGVTSVSGTTSRPLAPSESAEGRTSARAVAVSIRPTIAPAHGIAGDENSSQLVNFRYAVTTFVILGLGVLAICCGMIGTSVWLTVGGFILTLAGGMMYGSSLYDA